MPNPLNILLITADDMNWDAVGAYGSPVADATPNIDRLAAEGMRFDYAHITISVCQPSRSVLLTGRYPHRCGGEGFFTLRFPGIPILPGVLRDAGYRVGVLGKVVHSTPYKKFQWDLSYNVNDLGHGRNPALYKQYAKEFFDDAAALGKPFFLMANSHDPHRPFYGNDDPSWYQPGSDPLAVPPSRTFVPSDVRTPGFLPDLNDVRLEVSEYYSSVRRCDDTVGAILEALQEAGADRNTLVMFLSDNGMAFPYSKTNCYLQSTKTPWIVRWPGTVRPGSVNSEHFISGIDFMPTALDAAGVAIPAGVDGRSFVPLLRGESQEGREWLFTQFYQTSGRHNYPMRCVQNKEYGYIFSPWSNGVREFDNESQVGRTMAAMKEAAQHDPAIAQRVQFFLYRVVEEFYDFKRDPDALNNLMGDKWHLYEIKALQAVLETWMLETGDSALDAFRNRGSSQVLEQYMQQVAQEIGGIS